MTFDEVVEQSGVVKILKNTVKNNRIGHAYLFCGTRGTGKTTIAKIFARAVNCEAPQDGNPCNECEVCKGILSGSIMDVMEIDAASNNGVDNVRDIVEEVNYVPALARYKVYIIDEVHMLSTGAFNALLKTLEEPPSHVIFILATTDPNKIPATILSRCQRYDFKRITQESIVSRLETICEANGISWEPEALLYIAQAADGALRDAISILDQCLSMVNKNLNYENVLSILGVIDEEFSAKVVTAIIDRDVPSCLSYINELLAEGKDITRFVSEIMLYFRNMLIIKSVQNTERLVFVTKTVMEIMKSQAERVSQNEIVFFIKEIAAIERELKWSPQKKIVLEVGIIRLCSRTISYDGADLDEKLELLEKRLEEKISAALKGFKRAEASVAKTAPKENFSKKAKEEKKNFSQSEEESVLTGRPLDIQDLRDILSELKDRGNMKILSYLKGVRAEYYSENQINLIFSGSSKDIKRQAMMQRENFEVICDVFNKVLQKEYKIKMFNDDENVSGSFDSDEHDNIIDRAKKAGVPLEIL